MFIKLLYITCISNFTFISTHHAVCVDGYDLHAVINEVGGEANVDSCLLLVASQNPDIDPGFLQTLNGLRYPFLQTIFYASGS